MITRIRTQEKYYKVEKEVPICLGSMVKAKDNKKAQNP